MSKCDLCAGECRGHSLGHSEEWVPEPGSRAADQTSKVIEEIARLEEIAGELQQGGSTLAGLRDMGAEIYMLAAHLERRLAALNNESKPVENGRRLQEFLSKPFDGGSDNHGS